MSDSRKIAIIGAGPSGAIALDSFLKSGFEDITVFERNRVPAGTWNLDEHLGKYHSSPVPGIDANGDPDPPVVIPKEIINGNDKVKLPHDANRERHQTGSLYPHVETNVIGKLMSFSSKKIPLGDPEDSLKRFGVEDAFRKHNIIRDYVLSFFQDREKHLRLNTTVEKAWQPDGLNGRWRLALRSEDGTEVDEWYSEDFDFVYVAVGRFSVPSIPDIKGLQEAVQALPEGTILHAKTFRDPSLYKGKRVLLLGAGFSNVDVAHLVKSSGAKLPVHLSLRTVLPIAINGYAQPWVATHEAITEIYITDGSKLGVHFENGETLSDIDTLILGTGYRFSYPFLEEYVKHYEDGEIASSDGRRSKNLFWSTWWKYDPSLAVSASITDSVFWRFIEHQARATAGLWNRDRSEWPTLEIANQWEKERNAKGLYDFHTWWPHYDKLFSELARWGNYDPGDVDAYLKLHAESMALKDVGWNSLVESWLKDHPEDKSRLDETRDFLQRHAITRIGL